MPSSAVSSSCWICSTCVECPAKSTPGTAQLSTPSADSRSASPASASGSPETATEVGPLTAATSSLPAQAASRSRTRSTGSGTNSMPPCPDSARRARLRSATTLAASSRLSAPATQAAAISPCEWPRTASGRTP